MTNEREPLWTNERILDRYYALVPCEANMGDMEYWRTLRDVGERVSYELRNEYEAQLSNQYQRIERFVELVNQLEAQLAQRWEPLPDGAYGDLIVSGNEVNLWATDAHGLQWDASAVLPDNIRLCRLVTMGAENE